MSEKNEFQKVREETIRFMRGKYALDEVPGKYYGIDCLKFRQGKKTILSINLHEDHYETKTHSCRRCNMGNSALCAISVR
jgi:hypothetical protein